MDIGFILKQFVSFFVEPYGIVVTLFTVALFALFRANYTKAKLFLSSAFVLLLLFSYKPFAMFLVTNLEESYSKFEESNSSIKYIHVLGNGHTTDMMQPLSSKLSNAGTKRVLEGVLIAKTHPEAKLVFTGYKGKTDISNAQMNAELAIALGVPKSQLIINGKPKDTKEEALFLASFAKPSQNIVLVTSATHMPRAMRLFEKEGIHPIAAPTAYYKERIDTYWSAPHPYYFFLTQTAWHEYLGILWEKLKGVFP